MAHSFGLRDMLVMPFSCVTVSESLDGSVFQGSWEQEGAQDGAQRPTFPQGPGARLTVLCEAPGLCLSPSVHQNSPPSLGFPGLPHSPPRGASYLSEPSHVWPRGGHAPTHGTHTQLPACPSLKPCLPRPEARVSSGEGCMGSLRGRRWGPRTRLGPEHLSLLPHAGD